MVVIDGGETSEMAVTNVSPAAWRLVNVSPPPGADMRVTIAVASAADVHMTENVTTMPADELFCVSIARRPVATAATPPAGSMETTCTADAGTPSDNAATVTNALLACEVNVPNA